MLYVAGAWGRYPNEPRFATELARLQMRVAQHMPTRKKGLKQAAMGSNFATVALALNPLDPDSHAVAAELALMQDKYVCVGAACGAARAWFA